MNFGEPAYRVATLRSERGYLAAKRDASFGQPLDSLRGESAILMRQKSSQQRCKGVGLSSVLRQEITCSVLDPHHGVGRFFQFQTRFEVFLLRTSTQSSKAFVGSLFRGML